MASRLSRGRVGGSSVDSNRYFPLSGSLQGFQRAQPSIYHSEPAAERGAVGVDERGVGSDRGCEAMAVCI